MSPPAARSFYEALGVPPNAQKQDIRNAYRRLALQYHPDKNQGDSSAKTIFQEIQAAYETLSEDHRRAKYDTTAGFVQPGRSTRAWREPSYGPCNPYTQDPPFWSVELRAMTIQKCARITKIHHLERQIQDLVTTLDALTAAEDKALSKEKKKKKKAQALLFSFTTRSRLLKLNAQRHGDFLTKSACMNAHLSRIKDELRTSYDEHKKLLERDNERKTWWARERIRRVEEENRRAATTEAGAARRRAERAREHKNRHPEAADSDGNEWRHEQDEAARRAWAAKTEEGAQKRAREDPETVTRRREEAREWLARQRREMMEAER